MRGAHGSGPRLGDRLPRWFAGVVVTGCVLLLVAAIWREVRPREGVLSGNGLYTVRASADLKPEFVTAARTVEPGEVLARFRSPERHAEMAQLELQRQILETQRRIIELQPLTPDSELIRRYEKHDADQRQLLASLAQLIPDHALVVREKLRDALDKTERINALTTRIEDARREIQQAIARRDLARQHLKRAQQLSRDGAAAQIELDERVADDSVSTTEVGQLEAAIANMETERKHLQEAMPRFAVCTSQQADDIGREMTRVREQLAATKMELQAAGEQLTQDLRRAELLRTQMLSRLDLEIQQCRARLEGVQDTLVIKSPLRGVVVYADPAPGAALPLVPILVVAPGRGIRFRLRLPEAEIAPLANAGTVMLGLVTPVLHRCFPGRLLKWEKLPYEPGHVLAELMCEPPSEAIRDLTSRDWGSRDWALLPTMKVRLLWKAPIHASPLFAPALGLIAVGVLGLAVCRLRRRGAPASQAGVVQVATPPVPRGGAEASPDPVGTPAGDGTPLLAADIESGALGRNLQLLGQRLREAVHRQVVDPELLRAVEWAIDRHQTRALRHLAAGMDHDPELPESLRRLLRRLPAEGSEGDGSDGGTATPLRRLVRICRAVAPDLLRQAEAPSTEPRRAGAEAVLPDHSSVGRKTVPGGTRRPARP